MLREFAARLDRFGRNRSESLEAATLSKLMASAESQVALSDKSTPSDVTLYATALDSISQGVSFFDGDHRLILFNKLYADIYRLDAGDLKIGMSLQDIFDLRAAVNTCPAEGITNYLKYKGRLGPKGPFPARLVPLQDGRTIAVHRQQMPDGGWVATHEDVSEACRAEAQMKHMAMHDALTGLPNRLQFMELLVQVMLRPRREDEQIAVLCLDLDKFKEVNDTLGHAIGDRLLQEAAGRLRPLVEDSAMLARLGGDEFAIILPSAPRQEVVTALAARIIEALSNPFQIDGYETLVGVSIGIALWTQAMDRDFQRLLRQADMALYQAKGNGRGTFCIFEAEMDARLQLRKTLEKNLRRALRDDEFEVYYQPKFGAKREQITGVEALVRWRDPERGLISPADFIPVAEESGVIVAIGEKVLRMACRQAANWHPLKVAVNLSAVQARQRDLADIVESILRETNFEPYRLELEITESTLMSDTDSVLTTLKRLKQLGVRIAMDDFGTGYSSLGYLQRFPFDRLKIDRSFVCNIAEQQTAGKIVKATIDMSHALGIATTAEGVETRQQVALLRRHGCDELQGYYFSRPLTAAAFNRFRAEYVAAASPWRSGPSAHAATAAVGALVPSR